MQEKYVSLVELKGYILRNPALHGKPSPGLNGKGHRVMYLSKNRLGQAGLNEALVKGHGTVSGEFDRLCPLYRLYASLFNIQHKPTNSHCAYTDKEEKEAVMAHESICSVHNTKFLQKCL